MSASGRDFSRYALISLGANLPSGMGDPAATLLRAMERLKDLSEVAVLFSSLWESSPLDCPPGSPTYINAAAALLPRAGETPLSLLHKLQAIEAEFGRVRSGVRNEARVLDLDLIAFKNERIDSAELRLPHPRARERMFVLAPLREVLGGDWLLPGEVCSIDTLAESISDQEVRCLK